MSARLSRPRRTKVYDCNYNLGEQYYKPVVDDLDRKYSSRGHIADAAASADASFNSLRSALSDNESSLTTTLRRTAARAMEDREEDIVRRRPASALMEDYDSIFDSRINSDNLNKSRALLKASAAEDDEDETIQSNLKRLRAARAARRAIEEEADTVITSRSLRPKLIENFSEKVLDTVGLKHSDINKARVSLADDAINRRVLKVVSTTTAEQSEENPSWSRWSKVPDHESEDYDEQSFVRARKAARARVADLEAELGGDRAAEAAAERARKTRARLADIEDEMEALAVRGAQREKRAADLKAFIQENDGSSDLSSSATAAKSSLRVKKISSSVQAEKKTVTF